MNSAGELQISYREAEIADVAERLWQWAHKHPVWALSGGLGAGKTTLVRALCRHLGVEDAVHSPTFALVAEYRRPDGRPVYHMDWYRLSGEDEAVEAGLEDLMDAPGALCLVEWAEKAPGLLRPDAVWISIETTSETERTLTASVGAGN